MSQTPVLTLISFGSQRKEISHRSHALLRERFGSIEWIDAADARPRTSKMNGDWIWCVPAECELSLGALLRVEGVIEEGASGIHLFHVVGDLSTTTNSIDAFKQTVSDRWTFFQQSSLLMKRTTWESLFGDKEHFEIAELGLSGLEEEIHARGLTFEVHPERLHAQYTGLKLDWKQLYWRGRSWLRPWEIPNPWQRKGIAVVCFVRTPGVSDVKPALAREAGKDFAEAFYRTSLEAVEGLIEKVQQEDPIIPFWAIHEPHALQHPLWSGLRCVKQGDQSEPENMGRLYSQLLLKYRAVFFIGSDCPQMAAGHMKKAMVAVSQPCFVLGPASAGKWYLWGGNVPLPEHFWDCAPSEEDAFWKTFSEKLSGFAPVRQLETLSLIQKTDDLGEFTYQTKSPDSYSTRQFDALKRLALLGLHQRV